MTDEELAKLDALQDDEHPDIVALITETVPRLVAALRDARRERDIARQQHHDACRYTDKYQALAEAAEAEVARLRAQWETAHPTSNMCARCGRSLLVCICRAGGPGV